MSGLPKRLRPILPEMDLGQEAHRLRFENAINAFPHGAALDADAMNRMYEAQTLWDEYMAESASRCEGLMFVRLTRLLRLRDTKCFR